MKNPQAFGLNNSNPFLLALELFLLFALIPLLFFLELLPLPRIITLSLSSLYCWLILLKTPGFHFKKNWNFIKGKKYLPHILIRSLVVGITLFSLTYFFFPHLLFEFPKKRPLLWLLVMILYPLLSAFPQELTFRLFFSLRYKILFPKKIIYLITNAVLFAFLHIIYDNSIALMLSFCGGIFFIRTYEDSDSLFAVSLEHAIYGCLLFSSGLGKFFYKAPTS